MSVSKRLRYEILRRDNHACRYCGAKAPEAILTVDHVVPAALGGSDDPRNLVAACDDCNSGKSSSSPDATLVAEVEGDALRWARAQHLAAQKMVEDLERRDRVRAEFKAKWDSWRAGDGEPVALPDQWGASVDRFIAVGLPMSVLLDCVDKAMSNRRIRYDGLFRYMCGIAWKRVSELQQAATALVAPAVAETLELNSPYKDALGLLIGRLPTPEKLGDPAYVAGMAHEFDQAHDEDEDEDGNLVDYSSWPTSLKATVHAFERALDTEDDWGQHVSYLITSVLKDNFGNWIAESRKAFRANGDPRPEWADVLRMAAVLAVEDHVNADREPLPFETNDLARDPWGDD